MMKSLIVWLMNMRTNPKGCNKMNFMEAYNAAKAGKEVAWDSGDISKGLFYTEWDSDYEKLSWREAHGQDDKRVTLNRNTIDGWIVVEEPKKSLSDKRHDDSMCAESWDYREKDVKEAVKESINLIEDLGGDRLTICSMIAILKEKFGARLM